MEGIVDEKTAKNRMRSEIIYASPSFPRKSVLVRMMVMVGGKRRLKTAAEFGDNRKKLLGKTRLQKVATLAEFWRTKHIRMHR